MEMHELLERYEVRGDEHDFRAAKALYEEALARQQDAQLRLEYGYLLECHARNELRRAVDQYRQAATLDPAADKARYQLIQALAALFDREEMIALYRERVATLPDEVREYRFLTSALLAAGRAEEAQRVIDRGLALAPDDRVLIAQRGEARATVGDVEGALADWRRAVELDTSDVGPLYSSAYVLEREGRVADAIATWQAIIEWEQQGGQLAAEFPTRELERLLGQNRMR